MALESMIVPIPSEAVMPFVGFLVADGKWNLASAILVTSLGSIVGSSLSYLMGYYGGPWVPYWYLSDGGFFENLGVYELLRRRVRTSFLQHLPAVHRYYRYLLPLMPVAAAEWIPWWH